MIAFTPFPNTFYRPGVVVSSTAFTVTTYPSDIYANMDHLAAEEGRMGLERALAMEKQKRAARVKIVLGPKRGRWA